jgi:hypothetical protein
MRFAILVLAAVLAADAAACEVTPPEQRVSSKELIARTSNIVLAQVAKAELIADHEVRYTFKRITALSGSSDQIFTLMGSPAIGEHQIGTFDHHADPIFWSKGGRSPNDTDCQIHPAFSVGGTYLLFLDKPYHIKSFEQIIRTHGDKDTKDKWLQYVESNVIR